jgi:hypothetical protein
MLPLAAFVQAFLQQGHKILPNREKLILADLGRQRWYFITYDNPLALINCNKRLFMGVQTRDHMSYGIIIDENPFYVAYVMDIANPILPCYRYYPQYPF